MLILQHCPLPAYSRHDSFNGRTNLIYQGGNHAFSNRPISEEDVV